jgi:hypothetical protein
VSYIPKNCSQTNKQTRNSPQIGKAELHVGSSKKLQSQIIKTSKIKVKKLQGQSVLSL